MICAICNCTVYAQIIVVDDNVLFTHSIFNDSIIVQQDAGGTDSTGFGIRYDSATISPASGQLDEGVDVYLVRPGELFNAANIQSGQFEPLISFRAQIHPPVVIGSGDIYLGLNTGLGFQFTGIGSEHFPNRNAFGWMHLRPVNGALTMVQNVMSYDSRGIIVGTTMLVPEPATIAIAGYACVFLLGAVQRDRRKD
jgi:hypothetical protein